MQEEIEEKSAEIGFWQNCKTAWHFLFAHRNIRNSWAVVWTRQFRHFVIPVIISLKGVKLAEQDGESCIKLQYVWAAGKMGQKCSIKCIYEPDFTAEWHCLTSSVLSTTSLLNSCKCDLFSRPVIRKLGIINSYSKVIYSVWSRSFFFLLKVAGRCLPAPA